MKKYNTLSNVIFIFIAEFAFSSGIYFLLKIYIKDFFWAQTWALSCLAFYIYANTVFTLDALDKDEKNEKDQKDLENNQEN